MESEKPDILVVKGERNDVSRLETELLASRKLVNKYRLYFHSLLVLSSLLSGVCVRSFYMNREILDVAGETLDELGAADNELDRVYNGLNRADNELNRADNELSVCRSELLEQSSVLDQAIAVSDKMLDLLPISDPAISVLNHDGITVYVYLDSREDQTKLNIEKLNAEITAALDFISLNFQLPQGFNIYLRIRDIDGAAGDVRSFPRSGLTGGDGKSVGKVFDDYLNIDINTGINSQTITHELVHYIRGKLKFSTNNIDLEEFIAYAYQQKFARDYDESFYLPDETMIRFYNMLSPFLTSFIKSPRVRTTPVANLYNAKPTDLYKDLYDHILKIGLGTNLLFEVFGDDLQALNDFQNYTIKNPVYREIASYEDFISDLQEFKPKLAEKFSAIKFFEVASSEATVFDLVYDDIRGNFVAVHYEIVKSDDDYKVFPLSCNVEYAFKLKSGELFIYKLPLFEGEAISSFSFADLYIPFLGKFEINDIQEFLILKSDVVKEEKSFTMISK